MLKTLGIAGLLLLAGTATAQAAPQITPPGCDTAVQVGPRVPLKAGAEVIGSLAQYKGCGGKYGHVQVTTPASGFRASVHIGSDWESDGRTGAANQRDVWFFTDWLNHNCTHVSASIELAGKSHSGQTSTKACP